MKLLVVDDNRLLCRFLTSYLRYKGHLASSLYDPTIVKSWLDMNTCDGVILEILIPKMNGIKLLKMLRSEYPDLPIVMFTSLGNDEAVMTQCCVAGASGYVSKKLGPSEAYAAIMRAISHRSVANA